MFFPSIITRSCLQAVSFFTNNKSEDSSTVKPASRELILQLLSTGCLKFGQFTLKSGESSSYYIDLRQSTMHVELNKQIAKQIKFVIQNENKRPSDVVVVGVPYGVVPAASAAAILMDAPYLLVRKEVKAYGNETVSSLFKDREHILIEDVMTTGSSIIETINKLDGRKITDVIVIVDREGGGKENIKKAFPDLKVHSILRASDILKHHNDH